MEKIKETAVSSQTEETVSVPRIEKTDLKEETVCAVL